VIPEICLPCSNNCVHHFLLISFAFIPYGHVVTVDIICEAKNILFCLCHDQAINRGVGSGPLSCLSHEQEESNKPRHFCYLHHISIFFLGDRKSSQPKMPTCQEKTNALLTIPDISES
jgi:hypothetical protein